MIPRIIECEGYRARVEEDLSGTFHGKVLDITDVVNFTARSSRQLEKHFAQSLEIYFARCKEQGIEPQRPALYD
ncbi:MAG TPA: hypothetical protein VM939_04935 [Gemmatimonadaceae bacterium]|nr:hypothetical protein [Gemmatimonadaceae bacterium]